MSRFDHLSLDNSARFLHSIYPSVNWAWFLSKNLHGLTDGYPTIPFDNSSETVTYGLDDLKSFALLNGDGMFSENDITHHAEHFKHQLDVEMTMAQPSRILPIGDFMSPDTTPDKNYFQLSSGELYAMTDRIEQIMDIQSNAIEDLDALAMDIRSIGRQCIPTPNEIKEMYELADAQAEQVDYALTLLAEVLQAIEDRCERDLQDLIAALG